jgi:hypothetical protein
MALARQGEQSVSHFAISIVVFACVFDCELIGLLISSVKNSFWIVSSTTMSDDGTSAPAPREAPVVHCPFNL